MPFQFLLFQNRRVIKDRRILLKNGSTVFKAATFPLMVGFFKERRFGFDRRDPGFF